MKLRAIITCIILESPEGERIIIRKGITKLKIDDVFGSVVSWDDEGITLLTDDGHKTIRFKDMADIQEQ